MSDKHYNEQEMEKKLQGALQALKTDLGSVRTGRANPAMLDAISAEVYGAMTPIAQLGTVTVPEPRMLCLSVWDKAAVVPIEKAIVNSGLGISPVLDGMVIRLPIPVMTQERRIELTKLLGKYAEEAKIAIRHVRRHGLDALKLMEKEGHLGKDDVKREEEKLQKIIDKHIKDVDDLCKHKEEEIAKI